MYDMICRDHVMSAITWLKQHSTHYRDITLNEQWYSDITSRQLSLQLDESDNHITVNEDAVLNQSLKNDKINIETPKKDDNQELCTTEIESTKTGSSDTETDEDTEVAEEQFAINKRQELTGDPYQVFYRLKTQKIKYINVLLGKTTFPNIFYWTMILKF